MKKHDDQPKKTTTYLKRKRKASKLRVSSFNYAPDSHKEFCKRCFAHNGHCTNPGGPKACSL